MSVSDRLCRNGKEQTQHDAGYGSGFGGMVGLQVPDGPAAEKVGCTQCRQDKEQQVLYGEGNAGECETGGCQTEKYRNERRKAETQQLDADKNQELGREGGVGVEVAEKFHGRGL